MNNDKLDYNYKNESSLITIRKINKTIFSNNELPLIRVNIWIPQSTENTFVETNARNKFDSFFVNVADEFVTFAERALKHRFDLKTQINHPYSAVMKCVTAYHDEKYISIILDTFIFTEHGKSNTKRLSLNFERENCNIVISEDLFERKDFIKYLSLNSIDNKKKILKAFDLSDFYFVPKGILFFYDDYDEYITHIVSKKDFKL